MLETAIQRHMVGELPSDFDPMTVKGRPEARALRAERDLRERVTALGHRLRQSIEELHVAPANLERVVSTALSLARQAPLEPVPDPRRGARLFRLPVLHGTWSRAVAGLEDPLSGEPRPITFDRDRLDERQDVVLAHLGHPLVAMSTRLLRAAVWGSHHSGLHRVTACLSDQDLEAPVLAAYSRLVLVGADGVRLHEEVFASGGWLRGGRLSSMGAARLRQILDQALSTASRPAPPAARTALAAQWPAAREALAAIIAARAEELERSLRSRLAALREREIASLEEAVKQFRSTLERALTEAPYQQLELQLTEPDERDQLRRDVEGWRATLQGLDVQLEAEREQIARRYAEVRPLTFPAALVFVLPAREAGR